MRDGSPHFWLLHTAVMAGIAVFAYFRNPDNLSNVVMLGGLALACLARWVYLMIKNRK